VAYWVFLPGMECPAPLASNVISEQTSFRQSGGSIDTLCPRDHTLPAVSAAPSGAKLSSYMLCIFSRQGGAWCLQRSAETALYLPSAVQQLEDNVEARLSQARALRDTDPARAEPVVVAGDLKLAGRFPRVRNASEAGLHDAFAEGGKGYGYTTATSSPAKTLLASASWMAGSITSCLSSQLQCAWLQRQEQRMFPSTVR